MAYTRKKKEIDPEFLRLPLEALADAALDRARGLGATYADFRLERSKGQVITARDRELENLSNAETIGYCVRVIRKGSWGFAYGLELDPEPAAEVAAKAISVATTFASLNQRPVELAAEPVHRGTYISEYEVNPFDVPDGEKIDLVLSLNDTLLSSAKVDRADSYARQRLENKFFANLDGSHITQQRIRVDAEIDALKIDERSGEFQTMSSIAPAVGRGWEYLTDGYDYRREAVELPAMLEEKLAASSVEPGRYDLVLDPKNLALTIHESIGHSTELDRVLGHEANYAGTSFATLDKLNTLHFGSAVMNVTGDRIAPHGLSTIGHDDEGVAAQSWDIIRDGVLVGYQLNRQMAREVGFGRSNGCAFADGPSHVPLQRMPNVSLKPAEEDITLNDLIGGVDRGIYIVGSGSWSIDMQRYNFQFTGQRFYEIRGGKLGQQLKDVAYQSKTTDFWNSLEAVGGPSTYVLAGTFGCGKGQPGQTAPVSHGSPAALFRNVNVLNTAMEGST